ncbi:hypothetical protein DVU_2846 [Nitratidesulfovibrio vulgaris str. Hildenborough]|uniref:Uncharacterized protein n=1 Tax=Nitratidesulfovibrio vulgaris (strain ATCC 29579 / DSM 644 / CCUG 34227 / NCIMB 8303 / VKM B-1760 / Hildenborough) TaxID=882 RepID=Q727K9_NITV2|nr:hypothetical protein DVU_2846 [Nitratidesulfovibrio vulgaris str. Hildenborough]
MTKICIGSISKGRKTWQQLAPDAMPTRHGGSMHFTKGDMVFLWQIVSAFVMWRLSRF